MQSDAKGFLASWFRASTLVALWKRCFAALAVGCLLFSATEASAQILNTMYNFGFSDGDTPLGSMVLSGSTLYGATRNGGANGLGSLYKIGTDGTFSSLYSFSYNSGDEPSGAQLAVSGSNIFGDTWNDGPGGAYGTIYNIGTDGSNYTILHTFTSLSDPGQRPGGGTVLGGSTLYVAGESGTVVSMNTNGTGYTTIRSQTTSASDTLQLVGSTLYEMIRLQPPDRVRLRSLG